MGGFNVQAALYWAGVCGKATDVLVRSANGLVRRSTGWPSEALRIWHGFMTGPAGVSRRLSAWSKLNLPGNFVHILVALLFCTLVFGSFGIVGNAAQEILRSQAESTARGWASYLTANVPELRLIASGHPPSARSAAMFERAHGAGNIFLLEVLDVEGHPRFISHAMGSQALASNESQAERRDVIRQVRQGSVELETRRGQGAHEPTFFTDVMVPIIDGGAVIGILNVYIDMSQSYHALFRILTNATISFGLVLAVAFGLPGIGYWLRTRQKELAENQLRFLSQHDALTELANRPALMRRLDEVLAAGPPDSGKLAVLCMDLDHFKEVNDALGHEAGDLLLKDVAKRLRQTLKPSEHVARAGGDEFIVLQEGIGGRDSAADLAHRLLAVFSKPFEIGNHALRIGPSIGIAVGPDDGAEAESLVKNADMALHAVKSAGRGTFRFFDGAMDQQQQRRRHVAEQVRIACDKDGFELNFQPVYSLGTGLLAGFEALVRLREASGEMVPPSEFVPVAEELGLVTRIGGFVLETACEQAAKWPHDLTVAVNISPAEFREGRVVERVAAALERSGLDPGRLEIEVTEGVLLADTDTTRKTIDGLKKLGVAIVLDDFGTGYSSLSYLWQFRFDKIKIDQSFVRAIGKNDNVSDIIRTIIALGRALDVRVTAEGVETHAQAAVLRSMRCDLVQGYLYGAPVAQPDVPAFVSRPLPHSLADSAGREAALILAAI